jgi:hypothetical protein
VLPDASEPAGLSTVEGFTDDFTPSEYFLRFSEFDRDVLSPSTKLRTGLSKGAEAEQNTLVARGAREGRFNVVAGYNGLGRVVLFGSHPEFGYNLAMDQWDVPARMLANAAFWQAGHLKTPRPVSRRAAPGTPISFPAGGGLQAVSGHLNVIRELVRRLREQSAGARPAWLAENLAMSTFGLSGAEIWQQNLAAFDDVTKAMEQTIRCAGDFAQDAAHLANVLRSKDRTTALTLADLLDDALLGLEEAIHYRTPAEWHQDFGYEGVLQMLERTETMLRQADQEFGATFEPVANPYQYFETSPYHQVVGSYLAGIGVFANAWFLLRVHELRLSELVFKAHAIHMPHTF